MATVKFYLSKPKKNGSFVKDKVSIFGKFTIPPATEYRFNIPLDEKIEPQYWNFATQRVKSSASDYLAINGRLAEIESQVINLWREYRTKDFNEFRAKAIALGRPNVTKKHHIEQKKTEQKKTSVWPLFNEYIEILKIDYSKSVIERNQKLKDHLQTFNPTLSFEDMLPSFDVKFRQWLYLNIEVQDSTAYKYISTLKTYLKWACDRVIFSGSFLKWKVKECDPFPLSFDEDELKRIESLMFTNSYLALVRDWIVISCRTSMRSSDVIRIDERNFKESVLEYFMYKGHRRKVRLVRLPLDTAYTRPVYEIFKRHNFKLPSLPTQNLAHYVKLVCKIAGIKTKITKEVRVGDKYVMKTYEKWELCKFHTGRHTYITLAQNYMTDSQIQQTACVSEKVLKRYKGAIDLEKVKEPLNRMIG